MEVNLSEEEVNRSLRQFKNRRDDLLHEDVAAFKHHLERFIEHCRDDALVQSILAPLEEEFEPDVEAWWETFYEKRGEIQLPSNIDEELVLRLGIMESALEDRQKVFRFGSMKGQRKEGERTELFRSLIIRPFAEDLTHRLGKAANLASPEARDAQAVPLSRIPAQDETRIFLSHKTEDKALARRYYRALGEIGLDPWLDELDMPAGTKLERAIRKGFEDACAAVFFVTENFEDKEYLATEVDYAREQKREKGDKFAVVVLRYASEGEVPGILKPFTWKDISSDLEGFHELLRALPVETGPIRWKADVVG
jgi:hypothetical protein